MNTVPALDVARAYHGAWIEGRMDAAGAHLDAGLVVEVPINDYPTKSSFLDAVAATRGMASKIEMLSALGGDGEAVLLYDMTLPFGVMRVAEHFTVPAGQIIRLRQIHDTHALRVAMGVR